MPGYRRAYKTAKRLYPLALAAYHRWDNLSDAEKERYKEQARRIANQAAAYAKDAASRTPLQKKQQGRAEKQGRAGKQARSADARASRRRRP